MFHKNMIRAVDHHLCDTVISQDLIQNSQSSDRTEYKSYYPSTFLRRHPDIPAFMISYIRDPSHQLFI